MVPPSPLFVQQTNDIITERLRVALHEVSRMLDTGLDKETLGLLVALCEAGVNPEALAHGIRELHRVSETAASKSAQME
jgi:mitotic-spindle organizing protein 1